MCCLLLAAGFAACRTIDGRDWAVGGDKDKCEQYFNVYGPPTVQQGLSGIVLMHAAPWGIGICPDTLDRLIQYWKEAGYRFDTVRAAGRRQLSKKLHADCSNCFATLCGTLLSRLVTESG